MDDPNIQKKAGRVNWVFDVSYKKYFNVHTEFCTHFQFCTRLFGSLKNTEFSVSGITQVFFLIKTKRSVSSYSTAFFHDIKNRCCFRGNNLLD